MARHNSGELCCHATALVFLAVLNLILFILAGNDRIHESLDEFEIRVDPNTGFHDKRICMMGKTVSPLFSAVFHPFLFIIAGNDDMHESLDEFEYQPEWTTDC